ISLPNSSNSELVSCSNCLLPIEVYLNNLLTHDAVAIFIFQCSKNLAGLHVDDFARRWKGILAVHAKGNPSGLIPKFDARHLAGRHDSIVEYVQTLIVSIAQPNFRFIRRESNAMARTTVPLHRSLFKSPHFHAMQHLPRGNIADLESEEIIHIDITQCLGSVHGKRPHRL